MGIYYNLAVLIFILLAGCITAEHVNSVDQPVSQATESVPPIDVPVISPTETATAVAVQSSAAKQKQNMNTTQQENYSEVVEVNYRDYVDWFLSYNLHIRGYTPDEYVCGQYTVDMINASKTAGFKAYFGAIRFSDGTGHALVAFRSTQFSTTSWYFFEPQTNNRMTPETIKEVLNNKMGKTVTEVAVYGYFDDGEDKDPTTWRFAYTLYDRKY